MMVRNLLVKAGLDGSTIDVEDPATGETLGTFPRSGRPRVVWLGIDRGADAQRDLGLVSFLEKANQVS